MKYICVFITNLIAYLFKSLISIFNKVSADDIGEFISKRYYIIPSFISEKYNGLIPKISLPKTVQSFFLS